MSRDLAVELLTSDMRGEHSAIVQYLSHAYSLGEGAGEVPSEIEEIARDEMRHWRWVGELLVDLGAEPTIGRDPVFLGGAPSLLMLLDIEAEDRAIAQYEDHLARLGGIYPDVGKTISRILVDERFHRTVFVKLHAELDGSGEERPGDAHKGPFSGAAGAEGEIVVGGTVGDGKNGAVALLSDEMRRLYALVLEELHGALTAKRCPVQKMLLEDHAQWHMKHLGWIAEKIIDLGGEARFEHELKEPLPSDVAAMVRADAGRARETAARYLDEVNRIPDEEAQRILRRMAAHEEFQADGLAKLARIEEAPAPAAAPAPVASGTPSRPEGRSLRRLTVGNLIGKKQES